LDDPDVFCNQFTPANAVTVVGYGLDTSLNKPYFTIKTSWGTGWGDKVRQVIASHSGQYAICRSLPEGLRSAQLPSLKCQPLKP
jgi:hypothetical protein